jgi:hypothetical protein
MSRISDCKGTKFANLDDLGATITAALNEITPEWIASLTQYPFMINAPSIAGII